jgi:hypothetical protein
MVKGNKTLLLATIGQQNHNNIMRYKPEICLISSEAKNGKPFITSKYIKINNSYHEVNLYYKLSS